MTQAFNELTEAYRKTTEQLEAKQQQLDGLKADLECVYKTNAGLLDRNLREPSFENRSPLFMSIYGQTELLSRLLSEQENSAEEILRQQIRNRDSVVRSLEQQIRDLTGLSDTRSAKQLSGVRRNSFEHKHLDYKKLVNDLKQAPARVQRAEGGKNRTHSSKSWAPVLSKERPQNIVFTNWQEPKIIKESLRKG